MVVDGGWWWMVDRGGWSKKKFFNFAETLHTESTPKVIILLFGIWRENFLVGLKIDFNFFLKKREIFLQNQKKGNSFTNHVRLKKRGNLFTK